MYMYIAKIMVSGVQGQVVEMIQANSMSQARQIIEAKYSGRKITSWIGPTQIR